MSTIESPRRFWRNALLAAGLLLGAVPGCHLDMYDQPRYKPLSGSSFFANGQSARPLVEGTVAHGHERIDSLLYTGKVHGQPVDLFPYQVTDSIVRRGRDRFDIFCSPCHGRRGDGDGMIVRRGFPQPPSFLADSIRAYPAGFYFDVVTNGFGRMYSYASRVPVRDRWAIVAYIRALQLSRRVSVADLSATERKRLQETK